MFFRSQKEDPPEEDPPKDKVSEEKKAEEETSASEAGTEGTGFDDEIGDSSLDEGEYDVESSLDDETEDELEAGAEGKGLRVVIKEKNFATLDFNGNKVEDEDTEPVDSTGTVKVQNTGQTNRITGVDLELENLDEIQSEEDLEESSHIGVLAPGRENDWKFDYTFQKEFEPIKVTQEYYDPENGLSPNFLGGNETVFESKIVITNTSDESVFSIKGTKTLNDLASLEDSQITSGVISSEGNTVNFDIDEIEVEQSVEIILTLKAALPEDVPAYEAGELSVTYEHRDALTSGLAYKSVDGVSDFKRRIRRRQRETEPSFYDCEIVLENRSEFVYDLNQFSVFAGNLESKQMILDWNGEEASEDERELVPSEKVAFEFVYESLEGTPSFGDQIEFSVQTETLIAAQTQISIPGKPLKFMAIAIEKMFLDENGETKSDFEIPSYVETEVPTRVTLTGVGTYPLEGLVIRDEVPSGFRVENLDEVIVLRNGQEVSSDQYEVSVGATEGYEDESSSQESYSFDDEPDVEDTGDEDEDDTVVMEDSSDVQDTESDESLVIEFHHLEESDEQGFDKDETITVEYTVIADKLEPRDDPVRVQAHGEGYIYEDESSRVYAHSNIEDLNMVVIHRRDDVDISKFISARDHDGRDAYRIELEAENYGSSTVTMEIQDMIPVGFELVEGSIETSPEDRVEYQEPSSAEDGLIHGWTFTDVEPDNVISASYVLVETTEDANPRQLQSIYKG